MSIEGCDSTHPPLRPALNQRVFLRAVKASRGLLARLQLPRPSPARRPHHLPILTASPALRAPALCANAGHTSARSTKAFLHAKKALYNVILQDAPEGQMLPSAKC